jgi:hypothetical protein
MRHLVALPAAVAIIALVSAAASSNGVARKCVNAPILFPEAPDLVWVLDGKAIDTTNGKARMDAMRDTIESIEVTCAEPIYRRFAIKSRRGGIVIFTKPGPETVLRLRVDSVAKLHRAYTAARGKAAVNAEELGWRDSTGLITIEFARSAETGEWTVLGRHRWLEGPPQMATAKP